jgi:hypothetical protein
MPISVQCPGCGKAVHGGDELAGRRVRCPKCGEAFRLPGQAVVGASQASGESSGVSINHDADSRAESTRRLWPWIAASAVTFVLCALAGSWWLMGRPSKQLQRAAFVIPAVETKAVAAKNPISDKPEEPATAVTSTKVPNLTEENSVEATARLVTSLGTLVDAQLTNKVTLYLFDEKHVVNELETAGPHLKVKFTTAEAKFGPYHQADFSVTDEQGKSYPATMVDIGQVGYWHDAYQKPVIDTGEVERNSGSESINYVAFSVPHTVRRVKVRYQNDSEWVDVLPYEITASAVLKESAAPQSAQTAADLMANVGNVGSTEITIGSSVFEKNGDVTLLDGNGILKEIAMVIYSSKPRIPAATLAIRIPSSIAKGIFKIEYADSLLGKRVRARGNVSVVKCLALQAGEVDIPLIQVAAADDISILPESAVAASTPSSGNSFDRLLADIHQFPQAQRRGKIPSLRELVLTIEKFWPTVDAPVLLNTMSGQTFSTELNEGKLIERYGKPDEVSEDFIQVRDESGRDTRKESKMLRYGWLRILVDANGAIWAVKCNRDEFEKGPPK